MARGEPTHNLVIHYKVNRYTIRDVQSNSYTHLQMLSDVSDLALRDVPSNVSVYITLNLPIPGTFQTMEVRNDADLKSMFELYSKTENIHILLSVSHNPPLVVPPPGPQPNWLALDGVRRKGKKLGVEWRGEDMKAMADILLRQIRRSDGYEAGFRSDYKRDLRLQRAAILKGVAKTMASADAQLQTPQVETGNGLVGDDCEMEEWLRSFSDCSDVHQECGLVKTEKCKCCLSLI